MSNIFPYSGKKYRLTLGELIVTNEYSTDGKTVQIEFFSSDLKGTKMNVPYSWKELSDGNFLISWQEEDNSTVVHCDNFEKQKSHAFYTTMQGDFYVLEGKIEVL